MKGTSLTVEESIRLEAYLLSEQAGHPHGMETMFWAQAEAMVHGRTAVIAPSGPLKSSRTPTAAKSSVESKAAARRKAAPTVEKPEAQLLLAPEAPATKVPAKKATASKTKPKAEAPAKKVPAKRPAKK